MQEIEKTLRSRCAELIETGVCDRVLAWDGGEFFYDNTPAVFASAEAARNITATDDEPEGRNRKERRWFGKKKK